MCCRICNWEAISNTRWRCNYIARTIVIIPIPPLLLKWSAVFWRLCSFRVLIANATAIIERVVPTPIIRYCVDNIIKNNTWSAWDPENEKKFIHAFELQFPFLWFWLYLGILHCLLNFYLGLALQNCRSLKKRNWLELLLSKWLNILYSEMISLGTSPSWKLKYVNIKIQND